MQQLLIKYKYECATAVLCASLCLGMLAKPRVAAWLHASQKSGVIVYQAKTGKPLLEGSSVRDAVEQQLARFRSALAQVKGIDLETAEWADISPALSGVPRETANTIVRLSGSFYAADLRHGDLHGLDFRGVALQHAEFNGANLAGARLDGGQRAGASFVRANLSGAILGKPPAASDQGWPAGGNAPGARFHGCDLGGRVMTGRFSGASLLNANLRGTTLRLWNCEQLDLRGSDLTDGAIEIVQAASPGASADWDSGAFYATVHFDDTTQVQRLRLTGVTDPSVPFVQWALAHGAVLLEPTTSTK